MRHIFQRFGALALAIAMVFGMASAASAGVDQGEDPYDGTDGFTVMLSADFQYSINLTVTGRNINFGKVDSQGDETYAANVISCQDSRSFGPGAFYANTRVTTVTISSDGPYRVSATTSADSAFYVDRHNEVYADLCTQPQYGSVDDNLNNDSPVYQDPTIDEFGNDSPRDEYFYWGLQVAPGNGQIVDGDVVITYTAEQMP
jgi:hypothetical protein